MGLRHWNESELGSGGRHGHQQHAHEMLTRAHVAWFWLMGPGSSELLGAQFFEGTRVWDTHRERKQAERDCRIHGWSEQTLREVHAFAEELRASKRALAPKGNRSAPGASWKKRGSSLDGDGESSSGASVGAQQALLPTIERDFPETYLLTDAQKASMLAKALGKIGKSVPPPQNNARDRASGDRVTQAQAIVLFDGDDQGNSKVKDNEEWDVIA
jgi:hypothetical protein